MSKIIKVNKCLSHTIDGKFFLTSDQSQIVIHESSDGKLYKRKIIKLTGHQKSHEVTYDSSRIHPCSDNFESNFVFSCNDNILVLTFVTWWISVRAELHIGWNRLQKENKPIV